MQLRLVAVWPFVRVEPSARDVKVKEALRNFEQVEQRALGPEHRAEQPDDSASDSESTRRLKGNGRA